jgi:hypothetical protein
MGKKCSPEAFVRIPVEKFFRRGGEFPVAIPSSTAKQLNITLHAWA